MHCKEPAVELPLHSLPLSILLEALDGITYVTTPAGVLVAYGTGSWDRFAVRNACPALADPARVLDRSLFDSINGAEVRAAHQAAAEMVVRQRRSRVVYDYRCDSPSMRRECRMSIGPLLHGPEVAGLLYQSVILAEYPRPPMRLFDPTMDRCASWPVVSVCSYCLDVRLPGPQAHADWVTAERYYRLGGAEAVRLSHGICPACHERIVAPMLQTLHASPAGAEAPAEPPAQPSTSGCQVAYTP